MKANCLSLKEVHSRFRDKKIKLISKYKGSSVKSKLRCYCGKIFFTTPSKIFNGHTKSCGCYAVKYESLRKDISGKIFGKLKAIKRIGLDRCGQSIWLCNCLCGNKTQVVIGALMSNHIRSCGCAMYQYKKGNKSYLWKGCGKISAKLWWRIKNNALTRKIPFNISIQDAWKIFLKQKRQCAITGVKIDFADCSKNLSFTTASIDRIDSYKPYNLNNIQWVHKIVNSIKWDLTTEELFKWCKLILNPKEKIKRIIEIKRHPGNFGGCGNLRMAYWKTVIKRSFNNKIPLTITINDAWDKFKEQNGQCALTGLILDLKAGNQDASLDRIDSKMGYIKNNIQWIHKDVNRKIKGSLSKSELLKWCKLIVGGLEKRGFYYDSKKSQNS